MRRGVLKMPKRSRLCAVSPQHQLKFEASRNSMGTEFSGQLPDSFNWIQFGTVGGKKLQGQPFSMAFKERPERHSMMISCIIE